MKNIFIIGLMMMTAMPVMAFAPIDASIINVHDTQMIREQQFRRDEINDYKTVKEEKARFEKRNKTKSTVDNTSTTTTTTNSVPTSEPKLIQENGVLKIQY
jgi:hypothetical protein